MKFETRDGYRVWKIEDVLHEADVDGRSSYLVQNSWPRKGSETKYDPSEIFHLPMLGNQPAERVGPVGHRRQDARGRVCVVVRNQRQAAGAAPEDRESVRAAMRERLHRHARRGPLMFAEWRRARQDLEPE